MGRRIRRIAIAGAASVAVVVGCAGSELALQSNVPGASAGASITLLAKRGDYLDVIMESGKLRFRFFLPDDDRCTALFVSEQAVHYANVGSFGQLSTNDTTCDPKGILSLAEWRDRGPRRQRATVIPRSRAELREVVYADDDLTLIRGRYLLAREIGFLGGGDSIVVIPNVEECRGLSDRAEASMEFRPAGKNPFVLINGNQLCTVLGFVQPPPTPVP